VEWAEVCDVLAVEGDGRTRTAIRVARAFISKRHIAFSTVGRLFRSL
jgi:hypothetical protein